MTDVPPPGRCISFHSICHVSSLSCDFTSIYPLSTTPNTNSTHKLKHHPFHSCPTPSSSHTTSLDNPLTSGQHEVRSHQGRQRPN